MRLFHRTTEEEIAELEKRVSDRDDILRMKKTQGWKLLEKLFDEQLKSYVADNATEAKDWNDYLRKAGKIFGIQLVMVDVEDYIRQGDEAEEQLRLITDNR